MRNVATLTMRGAIVFLVLVVVTGQPPECNDDIYLCNLPLCVGPGVNAAQCCSGKTVPCGACKRCLVEIPAGESCAAIALTNERCAPNYSCRPLDYTCQIRP